MQMRFMRRIAAGLAITLGALGTTGCNPERSPSPGTTGTGGAGGDGQGGQGGGEGGAGGGQGGAGGEEPPECTTPGQCPTPQDACEIATCTAGKCGTALASAGTPIAVQTAGDCLQIVCDGSGGTVTQADDADLPDDGNDCTADACGDGIPTHTAEPEGALCNDEGGVACDGDGHCLPAVCGDGLVQGTEICDDGNTVGGDGCTTICTLDPGFICTASVPSTCFRPEAEPNGTCGAAPLSVPSSGLRIGASIMPMDDHDVFSFVVPATASVELETFSGHDGEECTGNIDTLLELRGQDCATVLASDDDGGQQWCSRIDPATTAAARRLAPGTYHARVMPAQQHQTIASYSLRIRLSSLCGNGVLEEYEECDDGNLTDGGSCQADCRVPRTCGNGVVEGTLGEVEACDDANTTAGDGCSALCAIEPGFTCLSPAPSTCFPYETEPNNACDLEAPPLTPDPSARIAGVMSHDSSHPLGRDQDFFPFLVPATASVRIRTFSGLTGDTCSPDMDAELRLLEQDCFSERMWDESGGSNPCPTIDPLDFFGGGARRLAPGTYFVELRAESNAYMPYNILIDFVSLCGNGIHESYEDCDDGNLTDGDGCDADCTFSLLCGNGVVQAGEPCDDGNQTPGDGCDAACLIEPGYGCEGSPSACVPVTFESEPNGTCGQADGALLLPSSPDAVGGITPTGDQDVYALVVPATATVDIDVGSGLTPGACADINPTLHLLGSDCVTPLASDDNSGPADCPRINPVNAPGARRLAPGTYFIRVEDVGNNHTIPVYNLRVQLTALCGNGVLEPYEICDDGNLTDGDGCESDCAPIRVCGNGVVELGEECDDGNLASGDGCQTDCKLTAVCGDRLRTEAEECDDGNAVGGDGCSAACAVEPGFFCAGTYPSTCGRPEVEPNNTRAEANARANAPIPVVFTGNGRVSGALLPINEGDFYRFNLATDATVRFEVFDGDGTSCNSKDKRIEVTSASYSGGGWIAYDPDHGVGCAARVLRLPAGSYHALVYTIGNRELSAYQLEIQVQQSAGAESEPNGTLATADPLHGSNVVVYGSLPAASDVDFFEVVVPVSGMSLMAAITDGNTDRCDRDDGAIEIEAQLRLFDAQGTELAQDSVSGIDYCAKIDGTSATNGHPGAHELDAGTYYLQVYGASQWWDGDYRLAVSLRGP